MPHEIFAVMIKSSGDKAALKPQMHGFCVSYTSSTSRAMINDLEERFPNSLSESGEGAMLTGSQAVDLLTYWQKEGFYENAAIAEDIMSMIKLGREGYTLLFIND